jgi:hypothetical protein
VLFHHDPYHTDDELEVLLDHARKRWQADESCICLAREGMTVDVDATGVRIALGGVTA